MLSNLTIGQFNQQIEHQTAGELGRKIESKYSEPILLDYNQIVSEQVDSLPRINASELFRQNQTNLEKLKQQRHELFNDVPPPFFQLTWDDIPATIDPETGEKVYEVKSGKYDENGNPNPEHDLLDQVPLPPDATIVVHSPNGTTAVYKTDSLGRVKSMEIKNVSIVDVNERQRDNNETSETKNLKDGRQNDHGGHLLGDQFGGCSEQINLVPMSPETNLSAVGKIERKIANAVKEGHSVTDYKVEPVYEGDSSRPSEFIISYKVDGKPVTTVVSNGGAQV